MGQLGPLCIRHTSHFCRRTRDLVMAVCKHDRSTSQETSSDGPARTYPFVSQTDWVTCRRTDTSHAVLAVPAECCSVCAPHRSRPSGQKPVGFIVRCVPHRHSCHLLTPLSCAAGTMWLSDWSRSPSPSSTARTTCAPSLHNPMPLDTHPCCRSAKHYWAGLEEPKTGPQMKGGHCTHVPGSVCLRLAPSVRTETGHLWLLGQLLDTVTVGECLPSAHSARARRATFLLTILTSARDLPSDGEGPPNRP